MSVTVRYFAAARTAAGTDSEQVADVATLAELVALLAGRGGPLGEVLARCSYLVDEVSPGTRSLTEVPLAADAVVDVLPPFSGG